MILHNFSFNAVGADRGRIRQHRYKLKRVGENGKSRNFTTATLELTFSLSSGRLWGWSLFKPEERRKRERERTGKKKNLNNTRAFIRRSYMNMNGREEKREGERMLKAHVNSRLLVIRIVDIHHRMTAIYSELSRRFPVGSFIHEMRCLSRVDDLRLEMCSPRSHRCQKFLLFFSSSRRGAWTQKMRIKIN